MGIQDRKKREKNLRCQQIQRAAKELFLLKGFNSTTIEDIAKKAELSPATIYLYFKSKDELFASLNFITLQYLVDEMKKVYDNKSLSPKEKMLKFKEGMYKTYKYDPLMLRNIMHIQLEDTLSVISEELINKLNSLSQKGMSMIAEVYEEGVRQGKFIKGHGMAHADIMWGIFTGLLLWEESKRRLNPKKDFLRPTLDRAFDIFCRGIEKSNSGIASEK